MATADRPTCVLLHGFTHTGRSWAPVIDRLGGRYDSIACDIRGHGDAADAVTALLRSAQLSPRGCDRGLRLAEVACISATVTGELPGSSGCSPTRGRP